MTRKRRPQRHAIAPYTQHREAPEINPQLAAAILDVVDTQLRDGTPLETRQTFERLVAEGYAPEGARQLLAHVYALCAATSVALLHSPGTQL